MTGAHAIKTDGTLWGWGQGYAGRIGDGTTTTRNSPVQIGTDWVLASEATYTSGAIKTNGTLWTWGYNNQGQLGQGNTINRSSPVQVGVLTTWVHVCAGRQSTSATKST
jgi:alpha-tubulin suppressor-like RCC1 family protein